MKNILIVTGHPYHTHSVANKKIVDLLKTKYPDSIHRDLAILYPDYKIDIPTEREKLLWADIIIIETPLFWYSMTSLIIRWIEEVFGYGWAYGSKGNALRNKKIIVGITAGASDSHYSQKNDMNITVNELIKPIKLTFEYCDMNFLGFVFTGGMTHSFNPSIEEIEMISEKAQNHTDNLIAKIEEYQ